MRSDLPGDRHVYVGIRCITPQSQCPGIDSPDPDGPTVSRIACLSRNLIENLLTDRTAQFARGIQIATSQANLQTIDVDLIFIHVSVPSSSGA
jgi:hypothetical protein